MEKQNTVNTQTNTRKQITHMLNKKPISFINKELLQKRNGNNELTKETQIALKHIKRWSISLIRQLQNQNH